MQVTAADERAVRTGLFILARAHQPVRLITKTGDLPPERVMVEPAARSGSSMGISKCTTFDMALPSPSGFHAHTPPGIQAGRAEGSGVAMDCAIYVRQRCRCLAGGAFR